MLPVQGGLRQMGVAYMTVGGGSNYSTSVNAATLPSQRLMRGSTSPTDPLLSLSAPYSLAIVNNVYALNTYVSEDAYVSGQYALAMTIKLIFAEGLSLADAAAINFTAALVLADGLGMGDSIATNREVMLSLLDSLTVTDTVTSTFVFNLTLPENLELTDTFYAPGGEYSVYVMNTSTSALSEYRNWDFNSMAKIGDKYYGASTEGLFLLEGDDDAGDPINAAVVTQSIDFRTQQLKSMSFAMLGIAQNGDMYLSVIHENNPTYTYQLVSSDEYMRNARVVIGKGMALRYWQFELVNSNGADFELESITYYPVVLTRRITER